MKIALSLILAGSLFVPNLAAQNIIVGWGGDSVSSTQNFNGLSAQTSTAGLNLNDPTRAGRLINPPGTDLNATDTLVGIPFSQITQLSPTTGYTGQRFYGGVYAGILNPATPQIIDQAEITNQGPNDVMSFRYALNANQHDSRLALYFDKADFLAGGNVNPVNIGASTTLNIRLAAPNSAQVNNDGEFRWIVRDSSNNWWISAADAAGRPNIRSNKDTSTPNPTPPGIKANTSYSFSVANGDLSYWAPYSPTVLPNTSGTVAPFQPGMNFEPAYDSPWVITTATNPFGLHTFNDITALGFYIEGDQFSTNVFQFTVDSFTFSAQVVPEPGTYALIGVLGLGYYSMRNLRKKKPAVEAKDAEKEESTPETTTVVAAV